MVITNLGEDHISWHGDLDSYHKAKLSLLDKANAEFLGLKTLIAQESDLARIKGLIELNESDLTLISLPEKGFANSWADFRSHDRMTLYFDSKDYSIDLPENGFFSYEHNRNNLAAAVFCLLVRVSYSL